MGWRRWARIARVVVGAVVAGATLMILGLVLTLNGQSEEYAARRGDRNNFRSIVGLAVVRGELPMKDGAFDPYEFVRRGDISRAEFDVFRSQRSKTGPTDEEVERGDYTNFPWERYRGERKLGGPRFLLLWEKQPDKKGGVNVGYSDGSATYLERAAFEAALAASR